MAEGTRGIPVQADFRGNCSDNVGLALRAIHTATSLWALGLSEGVTTNLYQPLPRIMVRVFATDQTQNEQLARSGCTGSSAKLHPSLSRNPGHPTLLGSRDEGRLPKGPAGSSWGPPACLAFNRASPQIPFFGEAFRAR